jgi:osmotically-inducible protein OsmY
MKTTRAFTRILARAARPAGHLAALTLATALLSACAPLLLGGAMVGGGMVALDRRTSGAQLEDQAIELKSLSRVRDLATLGNVSVTSYNRLLLITGEVPKDSDRAAVEQALARIENVRSVVNELVVAGNSSLSTRSNDAILSAKVKASFVDARDLQANAIKVVAERNIVYLMGRVTDREANRAAEVARTVPGVQKVVRVFELLSEAELADLQPRPAPR